MRSDVALPAGSGSVKIRLRVRSLARADRIGGVDTQLHYFRAVEIQIPWQVFAATVGVLMAAVAVVLWLVLRKRNRQP